MKHGFERKIDYAFQNFISVFGSAFIKLILCRIDFVRIDIEIK